MGRPLGAPFVPRSAAAFDVLVCTSESGDLMSTCRWATWTCFAAAGACCDSGCETGSSRRWRLLRLDMLALPARGVAQPQAGQRCLHVLPLPV